MGRLAVNANGLICPELLFLFQTYDNDTAFVRTIQLNMISCESS